MAKVIEAEGLRKEYEGVRALDDVSFAVEEGEVFALVGPNGAGKTTLLRILTDILQPDGGMLRLFGTENQRTVLSQIGYMPEERGLYKQQSCLETVAYFAQLKGLTGREARRAAQDALDRVGMGGHAKRKLEELSKGMSQRVQFAATIVHAPRLLILDEPFSGLDPVSARDMQALVQQQKAAGTTLLLSTHNMEHAEKLCDRLLMLHRGQAHLYGAIDEIKARYADHSFLVQTEEEIPAAAFVLPGTRFEVIRPRTLLLYPDNGMTRREVLAGLLREGWDVVRFEPVVPTLEEIFIRVAGAEGERALRETQEEVSSVV